MSRDTLTLSSGREVYCNGGIIGISPDLIVFEGYDGKPYMDALYDGDEPPNERGFWTADEKIELAELMIARWEQFKREAWGKR